MRGLKERWRKERFGRKVPESKDWRKGARKRGMAEGYWKAMIEGRVPERGVWRKGTGKRGLEEGCQKEGFGGRVRKARSVTSRLSDRLDRSLQ